jgi:hypothetical protein
MHFTSRHFDVFLQLVGEKMAGKVLRLNDPLE